MMRSSVSLLFVLALFSSGAIVVNCENSADENNKNNNNNNEWETYFFWFAPEIFTPTREQWVTQYDSDSETAAHSGEETFPKSHPYNDLNLPFSPFAVFPKTVSTAVTSHAKSSSNFSDEDDKDDADSKEDILPAPERPAHTENIPNEDIVAKTEKTTPEWVVPSKCEDRELEIEDLFPDYDMLERLLKVLNSYDVFNDPIITEKKMEPAVDPEIKISEQYYDYSISAEDSKKTPSCEQSAVKGDIVADSSDKLPEPKTLTPPKSETDNLIAKSSIGFVPLETTIAKRELNIAADESTPTPTAVKESKQHDATDDNKHAKKDYQMPHLSLRDLLKRFILRK